MITLTALGVGVGGLVHIQIHVPFRFAPSCLLLLPAFLAVERLFGKQLYVHVGVLINPFPAGMIFRAKQFNRSFFMAGLLAWERCGKGEEGKGQ